MESIKGVDFCGNPFYIARHLLRIDNYKHLKIVVVCPKSKETLLRKQLGNKLTVCRIESVRYLYYLAVAGFLVNDTTFPIYFSRRNEQKYLNTWHGIPLKTLGRKTAKDNITSVVNIQRNFFHTTHILAPNHHTESVLLKDYMIEHLWYGQVLRIGYPRNDVLALRQSFSNKNSNVIHVAFMPTWRGTLATAVKESKLKIEELRSLLDYLEKELPSNFVFWVKLHPQARCNIDLTKYKKIKTFPNNRETYEHLSSCHALVTDYSSVLFDFAVTQKPIFLLIEDIEKYRKERDFCIELNSLPFKQIRTQEDLVVNLSVLTKKNALQTREYTNFIDTYCPYDDGKCTKKTCKLFFLDENINNTQSVNNTDAKLNVAIYGGSLLNNGITASIKNLLSIVDTERYNFFLLFEKAGGEKNNPEYLYRLKHDIGFIPIQKCLAVDFIDAIKLTMRELLLKKWDKCDKFIIDLWTRERRRIFGVSQIDVFINYDGYTRQVAFLMLQPWKKKILFMHNDMAQELKASRVNDPRTLHLSYQLADKIATVREGLETSYCDEFNDIRERVIYVPNTLSTDCLIKSKGLLSESYQKEYESINFDYITQVLSSEGKFRFINLARFSPEKGQLRLIEAFEQVWDNYPDVQLFIVGAHGKLFFEVYQRAQSSRAKDSIFVVVGTANPFPIVSRMDAMVFSSFYEGIGLVLYEAFALGLPVISTDIPGPSELLNQGYGLVVNNNVNGLVYGMEAALDGKIPGRPYDFETHNQFALKQFYKLIEV
jgi:CDP-glycerol glycerophosphotransferase